MIENDFYVSIQGTMTAAKEAGWSLERIKQHIEAAANEWFEEEDRLPEVDDA